MTRALSGLRVVDASESIAGQFCCRMLADFGAEVLLVEPTAGSALRAKPPLDGQIPSAGSLLFRHLNLGKRSIAIDRFDIEGRASFRDLCRGADVIVVDETADRKGLQAVSPAAIIASVSDFGAEGPYSHWRGCEMVFQALSGMMFANGTRDRQPLYGVGHRSQYLAGVGLYISILSALHHRNATGTPGQHVSLEVAFNTCAMAPPVTLEYAYSRIEEPRGEQRSPFMVVKCLDGWICIWIQPHEWPGFCRALNDPSLAHDDRFVDPKTRQTHWSELAALTQEKTSNLQSDGLLHALLKERLAAAKAYTPLQLWRDMPHLAERQYWQSVSTPAGNRPILGAPFRLSRTPWRTESDAPALGEANALLKQTPCTEPPSHAAPHANAGGPLSGLCVLDLTTAWAGPMTGRILAFLGAQVVKVEAPARPDIWRMHGSVPNPKRYPDGTPGERPYNRAAQFNSQNHNKLGISLDIKHQEGLAALLTLVAKADALICNYTAGTLARMGLGYEVLKKVNPKLVVLEMPGFGNSGSLAKAAANGATMEMAAGMCSMIGYPGGAPTTTGPVYPDPMGGYNGAAAVLTALLHQQATGEGQYIEMSQTEAAMQFIGEEILSAISTDKDPVPCGNRVRWAAPHDAYAASGDDQWVAIAIETDKEWEALCNLMGTPELIGDERFLNFEARWKHQDELRPAITAWTRGRTKFEVADCLQKAGIRAAPVNSAKDVFGSPYLASRAAFDTLTHPEAGTHQYMTLPFRFEHTPAAQRRPSPCFGADTRMVLRELAGLSEHQIKKLADSGAISEQLVDSSKKG